MSFYGKLSDLLRSESKERYHDYTNNGKCSRCGECCTDLLPLNDAELRRLKQYAEKHHLSEHHLPVFWDPHAVDLTCPFWNEAAKCCDVYPVRPEICRSFICSKPKDQVIAERDAITESRRRIRSLRYEVFENHESLQILMMYRIAAANNMNES